jgi:murein DD-endopeptidase MepM/ murein hydrolase activator NlpD
VQHPKQTISPSLLALILVAGLAATGLAGTGLVAGSRAGRIDASGFVHGAAGGAAMPRQVVPITFAWPTVGRRIAVAYGERANPRTGTVTVNPGIDIAAKAGQPVTAAASGKVSLTSWLPSYGNVVIVQHRGGYRTVYGKLGKAQVVRGRAVKQGERIGTARGSAVHFEVWLGRKRLNPASVLR